MSKMKDEWYEEFYGEDYSHLPFDTPRWHQANPKGEKNEVPNKKSEKKSGIRFVAWENLPLGDQIEMEFAEEIHNQSELEAHLIRIQDELADLLLAKHEDYGPKNISNSPGGPLHGINVRMYDKLARLEHLIGNKKQAVNESLRDSYVDIANYAMIALLVLDGNWEK